MHIVIGGAFNGKRKWVENQYQNSKEIKWCSEPTQELKELLPSEKKMTLILFDIEKWTKQWLKNYSVNEAREVGRAWSAQLKHWESESAERQVILLATDFSKGIVPIEKAERDWRDLTGWFYQDLVKEAERVDEVWYGLGRQLK